MSCQSPQFVLFNPPTHYIHWRYHLKPNKPINRGTHIHSNQIYPSKNINPSKTNINTHQYSSTEAQIGPAVSAEMQDLLHCALRIAEGSSGFALEQRRWEALQQLRGALHRRAADGLGGSEGSRGIYRDFVGIYGGSMVDLWWILLSSGDICGF